MGNQSSSKHIVFLAVDFSLRSSGGIGTYLETMAAGLAARGHRVTVVVPQGHGRESRTIRIVEIDAKDIAYEQRRLELSKRFALALDVIHKESPINVVEATDYGLEGLVAMRQGKFPLVVRLHTPESMVCELNDETRMQDTEAVKIAEAEYFRGAKHLSSPSHAMKNQLILRWGSEDERIRFLPNPAIVRGNQEGIPRIHQEPTRRLAFLGRLERRKGVYVLAEALRMVLPQRPELEFEFLGANTRTKDGSVGSDIQKKLAEFADRVRFRGHVLGEEKFQCLNCCHGVVLPSLWENFPYACLEAMACGKPILATRDCGFEEMIRDGINGRLVSPGDPVELGNAILTMVDQSFPLLTTVNEQYLQSISPSVLLPEFERYYQQVEETWI
jgi:glycogen synthase